MSEEPTPNPVQITAEEHSRPVFRLLARAFILLARQHQAAEPPPEPNVNPNGDEGDGHGDA